MAECNLNVLLLDDEPGSLACSQLALAHFVPRESIFCADTVEQAVEILQSQSIQMAFLDVELTHSNGFALCDYIHQNYPQIAVVILTGHVDLGAQSYDYQPFDFLTKPVDLLRMEKTFRRYRQRQAGAESRRVMIESGPGFILVDPRDILYIVKEGSACQVHCVGGEQYRVSHSLDRLETMLAGYDFFRTHQSYLVPVSRIQQVQSTRFGNTYEARLDDGSSVPVSRNKYAKLKEYILRHSMHLL